MADDERDPIEVGDVINGRFRVERVLGRGGMGVVVKALHIPLQEYVAIKLLRVEGAREARSRERFLREARASARLRSEHVVRLMDYGLYENGSPVIVMEYLEGSDLGALLDKYGRLSVDDTVEYLLQAAEGIAEAHAHGLIHRDLKPANLFISRTTDGSALVKVLDFGVSKPSAHVEDAATAGLTGAKSVVGSPGYMSPEQLSGESTDARTDIWALGVILFQCLTEELPFQGRTVPQLFSAILNETPPSLSIYRSDLPACLQNLVDSCLHKTASSRCPDTASFASRLVEAAPTPHRSLRVERIARLANVAAGTDIPRAPLVSDPPTEAAWTRKRPERRKPRLWPWAFAIGMAALTAGVGLLMWTQSGTPRPRGANETAVASSPVAPTQPAERSSSIEQPPARIDIPLVVRSAEPSAKRDGPRPAARESSTRPPPTAHETTRDSPPAKTRPTPKADPLDGWEPLEEE